MLRLESLTESVQQRFWDKVKISRKPNGCWLWIAVKQTDGYGCLNVEGSMQLAHRISWMIHRDEIPEGILVLHNCPNGDNPACVNPNHLWLGSDLDNARDRGSKGRNACGASHGFRLHPEAIARGQKHGRAVLTEVKIKQARDLRQLNWSYDRIGKEFSVSGVAIWYALNKKTWKHIPS